MLLYIIGKDNYVSINYIVNIRINSAIEFIL